MIGKMKESVVSARGYRRRVGGLTLLDSGGIQCQPDIRLT
jgi:hypothetical protein